MPSPLSLRQCLQERGIDPNGGIRTAMRSASVTSVRALCSIPPSSFTPSLDGREATQAIQDINHTVTLIASKRTVVRMYLSSPSIGSGVTVRGELALQRLPEAPVVTIPSVNTVVLSPAQIGQLDTKRRDVQLSLNFLLPVDQTTAGSIQFSLASLTNATTGIPFDVSLNNLNARTTVIFTRSPPLRLRILGMRYKQGTPPVPSLRQCLQVRGIDPNGGIRTAMRSASVTSVRALCGTHAPTDLDFDLINSWLRRAYPVAEVLSTQAIVDATASPPFSCTDINAQLAAIRRNDMAQPVPPVDRRTHYYGLVRDNTDDGGFFMRGCSATIPRRPDPEAVAAGPTGNPATQGFGYNWDTDGSYGDWYTGHELGHTLGRRHPGYCADASTRVDCRAFNPAVPGGDPNCQAADDPSYPFVNGQLANADNAFVGFDVGDPDEGLPMAALPGVVWHDVMTYCRRQWLSSYTYLNIRRRLRREDRGDFGPSGGPRSGSGAGMPPGDQVGTSMPPGDQVPETITTEEAAAQRTLISVVATVNLTKGEGKIEYVNPLSQGVASRTEPDSPVMLRVKGADGQLLHEYRVSVKPFSDTPGPDRLALVDVVLPVDAYARAIELSVAGRTVDSFQASATPPRVPELSRVDAERDTLSMAWETEAETGADHTYIVQISVDNGRTWQTLAVGLATPAVTIDRNQFRGAENVLVRVTATDGFRSSVVTSEPLSIDTQ